MKRLVYLTIGTLLLGCSLSDNLENKVVTQKEISQMKMEANNLDCPLIHYAIQNLRFDIVKILVNRGGDVNEEDNRGRNALYYFSLTQRDPNDYDVDFKSVGEFLIKHGADVNWRDCAGNSTLHGNVHNTAIAKLLISKGVDVNIKNREGQTALHLCVYNFDSTRTTACAEILLEAGADINAQDYEGQTALHYAIKCDNVEALKLLLKKGANANLKDKRGNTPLGLAQKEGRLEVIGLLSDSVESKQLKYVNFFKAINHDDISYINDISKESIDSFIRKYKVSPLILAVMKNKVKVAEFLISKGADINAVCVLPKDYKFLGEYLVEIEEYAISGWTALHIAVCKESAEMVKILANKKTVNKEDKNGCTPLCLARENSDISKILIDNGADTKVLEEKI